MPVLSYQGQKRNSNPSYTKSSTISFHILAKIGSKRQWCYFGFFLLLATEAIIHQQVGSDVASSLLLMIPSNSPTNAPTSASTQSPIKSTSGSPSKASRKASKRPGSSMSVSPMVTVDNCSARQKEAVFNQTKGEGPGLSSLSALTACPDSANWLEDFYFNSQQNNSNDFLAINIGCNKGYDSLDLLRMGTRQPLVFKQPWTESAFKDADPPACGPSVMDVNLKLPPNSTPRRGDVYCVEPMPTTIEALKNASEATGMEEKGLHIVQAAVSNEIGTAQFPVMHIGVEHLGLGEHIDKGPSLQYQDVPLMTLDEFGKRHMSQHFNGQRINVLLIDTEGYDFEVMKGGETMMKHVEYIEFEFHMVRPWREQSLRDAIDMLDHRGFTCYWSGRQKLWRITKCWQDHFNIHGWSNVACVHNKNKPDLAIKMEQVFHQTINQE